MICCESCFNDLYIKSIIKSLNQKGECDVCGSINKYVYDTDANNELVEKFNELIDIYSVVSDIKNYPVEKSKMLKDDLIDRWKIFNTSSEKAYKIIKEICKEKYECNTKLFTQPVGIAELIMEDYLKEHSIFANSSLKEFKNEIQRKNRYHLKGINKEVLGIYFSYLQDEFKAGEKMYRGRISNKQGYNNLQMGAPPYEKTLAGRINSQGIRCLYLADTEDTAICEIRAKAYNYVTIGTFVLRRDIKIIDISKINSISPFEGELDITQYSVNKIHLDEIEEELTRPLREENGVLEYVPIQYICDFIKSLGYDGIKYKSTMNEENEGYNIAILNEQLIECLDKDFVADKGIECIATKVFDIRVSYKKSFVMQY
ncbi:RES domain-containing protein [Clostridium perfringens]|nr:RES domain-containing protein [Clostridium perfringens]MDK0803362.1 RES family NAD+ phosphorylase [Clostridium perfringens]HAT4292861.1 RES family NAD+ phosphorylase [Clostridium perfringens]